jgi:hypothetical protein
MILGRQLVAALSLAAVAATMGRAQAANSPHCGAPGKPPCPLQRWMRREVAAPYAKRHDAALAKHLAELVRVNPEPSRWHHWDLFAREGAADAREHRDPVLSCVRCHDVYRAKYNAKYRERSLAFRQGS